MVHDLDSGYENWVERAAVLMVEIKERHQRLVTAGQ